jgi:hypothetical protein
LHTSNGFYTRRHASSSSPHLCPSLQPTLLLLLLLLLLLAVVVTLTVMAIL